MKISVLISSAEHPVSLYIRNWSIEQSKAHEINIIYSQKELSGGDILFLVSCSDVVSKKDRDKYRKTLVLHASDLPNGRGWNPHIWELINGKSEIILSLIEAEDQIDSGDIWKKIRVNIPRIALYDEINQLIINAELELMSFAILSLGKIKPIKQSDIGASYWPKRSPNDSEIDINECLEKQFDLIRVCDPNRFPAFFYKNGKKFIIKIESADE